MSFPGNLVSKPREQREQPTIDSTNVPMSQLRAFHPVAYNGKPGLLDICIQLHMTKRVDEYAVIVKDCIKCMTSGVHFLERKQ